MKITKAIFDLMPATLQATFKPVEGEADTFDNGEESAASLKSALDAEKAAKVKAAQDRDAYKAQVDAAEAAKKAAEEKEAREKGDFTKIEADYKQRIADAEKKAADTAALFETSQITTFKQGVINQLLPSFVSNIAGAAILERYIKIEKDDQGKPFARFLDDAGNPTGQDLTTFQKNLLANPDLKSVIKASNGNGGGATGSSGGGGATPTKLSDFKSLTERSKFALSNPVEYAAMLKAEES